VNLFLLILFGIHFGVALVLYVRRGQWIYGALAAVFLCLAASALIKRCVPLWTVFDIEMSTVLRVVAIALSCLTVGLRAGNALTAKRRKMAAD